MTKTKQMYEYHDDNENDDNENDDSFLSDKISLIKNIGSEVIVDVMFYTFGKSTVMKIYTLSISEDGEDGFYRTHTYILDNDKHNNGLFDFLDDLYSKRIIFFQSGKNVQALMYALFKTEEFFYKTCCFNFKEYCEFISEAALSETAKSDFSNPLTNKVLSGYGLSEESKILFEKRSFNVSIGKHIPKLIKKLKNEYDKVVEKYEKKFCCVCINSTEKITPSFLVDPTIGLPLVVYSPEFAEVFLKKQLKSIIESSILDTVGIDEIKIDLWGIMPNTTVKELISIFGNDGDVKCDYTDEDMESLDFIIAKFKSLHLSKKIYDKTKEKNETVLSI